MSRGVLPIDLVTPPGARISGGGGGGRRPPGAPGGGDGGDLLAEVRKIAAGIYVLANQQILRQGMASEVVTVGTSPTLIFRDPSDRSILILNPASPATTTFGTLLPLAVRGGSGDTQADPVSVANYQSLRLFLRITVTGGATNTIAINTQTRDPLGLGWAGVADDVFNGVVGSPGGSPFAVGTYYAPIGGNGVDIAFAVSYAVGAGTPTWSLSYVAKDGLPGSAAGADRTVYMGPPGVQTAFGFPLLEGGERSFFVKGNTPLYAVAASATPVRVFRL